MDELAIGKDSRELTTIVKPGDVVQSIIQVIILLKWKMLD